MPSRPWPSALEGLVEGVDELEHGALIGGGEGLDQPVAERGGECPMIHRCVRARPSEARPLTV